MNKQPENLSAFPLTMQQHESIGMTLRDYFAAKAMQSIINQQLQYNDVVRHFTAETSYKIADAMLLERSKTDE